MAKSESLKLWKIVVIAVLVLSLLIPSLHGISANANDGDVPHLLITELIPNTDNYAGYDAFEFIEVYNNSNEPIDLQGYRIRSGSWNVEISESLVIEPWDTQIFWTRRQEIDPITLEGFNFNYFRSYSSKHLSEEKVYILGHIGGLVNSGNQTVVITDPNGVEVVRANYTGADVFANKSIYFSYPKDGSNVMENLGGTFVSTPGWVEPYQVPTRPVFDTEAPATPKNVQAVAGNGSIHVTWDANSEPDIYRYHIYKNGDLEFSVYPHQQEFTISMLLGNQEYVIEVAAEDVSGNLSNKSTPIRVTPGHQLITQEQRSFPEKDPRYEDLWKLSEDGPIIPGLAQDLIPQGLTYYKKEKWLLVSNYLEDGRPSTITIVNERTGDLVKSVLLYDENGNPYNGHVGGITVSKNHVWIASERYLFPIKITDIVNAPNNGEVQFIKRIPVPVNASYAFFDEKILWVGEFYEANSYPTDPSHHIETRTGQMHYAWMVGYDISPSNDMISDKQWNGNPNNVAVPDYVLSTTDKVQGAIVNKKGVTLSTSYGRGNDSVLYRYEHPLKEQPHHYVEIEGKNVPLWFLDGYQSKPVESITTIPMHEGIVDVHPKYLYVLVESGANKYRYTTTYPMDRMIKIDLKKLMKEDKENH